MKSILSILGLTVLMVGCSPPSKEYVLDIHGLEFTCPAGWSVTDDEDLGDGAYYVSVEKDGLTSSGLVTISWVEDSVDLYWWLKEFEAGFVQDGKFKNLQFTGTREAPFQGNDAVFSNYSGKVIGLEHSGTITVFHSNNRSYCYLEQEADEDNSANASGFKTIRESFHCKN